MGLLKNRPDAGEIENLDHEDHAAKAARLLSRNTAGGFQQHQATLMAANAHATLALYKLLREREN